MSRDGVALLAYPISMCWNTWGPWWIASLNNIFIPLYVQLALIGFNTCQEICMGLIIQKEIKHSHHLQKTHKLLMTIIYKVFTVETLRLLWKYK